ncbi:porin [Alkalilimnicola ehrlichii]|nr:porin [Alkalilimnicola ehrlichii]
MKSKTLAAITLATLSCSAFANPSIDLYGQAHVSLDLLDDGDDMGLNVSSNASHLGLRGSYSIEDNLHLLYQLEQEYRHNSRGSDFANRDTFVGLHGDFGLLRVGHMDTPFKALRNRIDLFGNQVGDARNMTGGVTEDRSWDTRFPNSIYYQTPEMDGFSAAVQYATTWDPDGTSDNDDSAISAALAYTGGPLFAAAALERRSNPGDSNFNAIRLAGGYKLDNRTQVTGLIQRSDDEDNETDTILGAGVLRDLGYTNLKAQVFWLNGGSDDSDAVMVAVGADHRLSRELTVYLTAAFVSNDDEQSLTPYNAGRTASPDDGATGEVTMGLSAGVIFNF